MAKTRFEIAYANGTLPGLPDAVEKYTVNMLEWTFVAVMVLVIFVLR